MLVVPVFKPLICGQCYSINLPTSLVQNHRQSCLYKALNYEGNSISKLQIQVATYVFELSAGNCHR